ncbi:MAG: type II toxin-antitoxin system HicA family toxin [Pseudomonadota bacterium]
MRQLKEAGFTFEEGGRHTKVYKDGVKISVIPRHTEVTERTVRSIEKQTGVRFK